MLIRTMDDNCEREEKIINEESIQFIFTQFQSTVVSKFTSSYIYVIGSVKIRVLKT